MSVAALIGMVLLDLVPWWVVLIGTVALLLLAMEIGFRLGRRRARVDTGNRSAQIGVLVGAILALLGLLLAFSFSIVEGRFASRKELVLEEANAIGTAYLRAGYLPEPHSERAQELLRAYVNVRLNATSPVALEEAISESEELHRELWAEAVTLSRTEPVSRMIPLFVNVLNEVIDLHEARVTVALHQRLPGLILATLFAVSVLAMTMLGYYAGLGRWRSLLPTVIVGIAIASVIVLIIELDRPGTRLFHVSQSAIRDVHETMQDPGYDADRAIEQRSSRLHTPTGTTSRW